MKTRLLTYSLLLVPQLASAAEKAAEPSLLYASLKMVGALIVIIGLLLLLFAASRKGFGFMPKARGGSIKVLETKPLGGKKFLCVVSVRGEDMLLGMSNERIDYLTKLPPAKEFSAELQQLEEGSA
jgi:flagellar protein FliO/FliZ